MAEKAKSLLQSMKDNIAKSGSSRKNAFFVKSGSKKRIRFITDFEDGLPVDFHSVWQSFDIPCLTYFKKPCPKCESDEDGIRHYQLYVWTVYDYEEKVRKLFMYKANKCSPTPDMIDKFEIYETLTDRDYYISRKGEKTDTTYSLTPMEPKTFKGGSKIKPFTKNEIFKNLKEMNLDDLKSILAAAKEEEPDDDEIEEKPKPSKKSNKKKKQPEPEPDIEEDDDDIDDEDDDEELDI